MNDRLLRLIGIPLVALIFPLIFHAPGGPSLPYAAVITVLCTWLIWESNRIFIFRLREWLRWEAHPAAHIIVQALGSIVMVVVVVTGADLLVFTYIYHVPLDSDTLGKSIALGILLTLMMNTFYESIYFSQKWKSAFVKAEVLRRENLQSHFANLKNQVSPHFLFNSLNTLTILIEENKTLAKQFTRELSNIYQYVLESRQWMLVEVKKELEFTRTYIFLQNIRFGEALLLNINLDEETLNTWIPPLTLQMLVENAVKHNVVSASRPLTIEIGRQDNFIFVRNNFQKKSLLENSTGIGLQNIDNRYNFCGAGEIVIRQEEDYFTVELPLIPVNKEQAMQTV